MKSGGLFAGYGGLDMAVAEVFGAEPAWFSEIEDAPSKILAHHWPTVPNHGDITQIDWDQVEPVDILTGGFPCQDMSVAGKRAGLHPETRSGLWNHMVYGISKLRPRYVVAENVRGLLSAEAHSDVEPCPWCLGDGSNEHALRALGAVLGDLADLGYDAEWCGLRAADVGAPHGRFRIFVLAAAAAVIGHERSGSTRDRRSGLADGGVLAAAADSDAVREQPIRLTGCRGAPLARLAGASAAYAERGGRIGWTPHPIREPVGRTAPAGSGTPTEWAEYGPAVHRWEQILGRLAPAPTELGSRGAPRLAPRFVEWMQGLPAGHVTGVPNVNRNAQLKALGNGVVPQQAVAALRYMCTAREVA
jgi:DNA (cytosine-5)-methyltransferase 1